MTEAEREQYEYEELERIEAFQIWEAHCIQSGNNVVGIDPWRSQFYSQKGYPHRIDWRHDRGMNAYRCLSPENVRQMLRQLQGQL